MSDTPKPEQDAKGRFVTGNIGGGRPKGARAKLGEAFLKALQEDFAENGVEAVQKVREEKPDQYLKVIASLMPKEIDLGDPLTDALARALDLNTLSDDALREIAAAQAPLQSSKDKTIQ